MKNYWLSPMLLLLLAGCTATDKNPTIDNKNEDENVVNEEKVEEKPDINESPQSNEDDEAMKNNSNETEALADFQSKIPNDWKVTIPSDLPIANGQYLTAFTTTENNIITFNFYETTKPFEINDERIQETGNYIGQLTITKYSSDNLAEDEIGHIEFNQGQTVNLGYGITGYQDAGAGSVFTSWNEGRWAIIARSLTEKTDEGIALAKQTVEFLETNTLPIPKQYGYLSVDTEDSGTRAKWQKQNYIYEMTDFGQQTLNWLVKFK